MAKLSRFAGAVTLLVAAGIAMARDYAAQSKPSFSLETLSPQFSKLIAPGTKLEMIATGFGFMEGRSGIPAGSCGSAMRP
jgi:hypothetical protein